MLNTGMELEEAVGLRRQAVVKTRVWMHLNLQQHHGKLTAAGFRATCTVAGPEHAIEAVAQLLEFQGLKAVEAIAGLGWIQS
jgi:hypothetical protein